MRAIALIGLVLLAASALSSALAQITCEPCGPTYCKETAAYTAALARKKADAGRNAPTPPARLIGLYDRLDRCEACVTTAPDGFSVLLVAKNGDMRVSAWGPQAERDGAARVASGELKECHVVLARRACACCGSPSYDKRADYRKDIDLNTDMALKCQSGPG
jgi:hypothetical protein